MPLAAIGQITSTASLSNNLAQCRILVEKAASKGAAALFLPEASDYIGLPPSQCQSVEKSEFVLGLQDAIRKHKIPVHVGIHEPAEGKDAGKKVKNTLLWIDEEGKIKHRYQKLHMFDVDIKDGPVLKESDNVEPGPCIEQPFDTLVGKIGPLICYDIRFPEPALALRSRGAQIITYPSAFTAPTGEAGHWHTLLRARAIETQSYIIAAAQVGYHDAEHKRCSYGHSMIIDPWGRIVAELGGVGNGGAGVVGGERIDGSEDVGNGDGGIAVAEIDLEVVEKTRREMPLWEQRRTDVYPEIL